MLSEVRGSRVCLMDRFRVESLRPLSHAPVPLFSWGGGGLQCLVRGINQERSHVISDTLGDDLMLREALWDKCVFPGLFILSK